VAVAEDYLSLIKNAFYPITVLMNHIFFPHIGASYFRQLRKDWEELVETVVSVEMLVEFQFQKAAVETH
jgi:hypothetical protein